MSEAYEPTTLVLTHPKLGIAAVANRYETKHAAGEARRHFERLGYEARCEPWKPSDVKGEPWTSNVVEPITRNVLESALVRATSPLAKATSPAPAGWRFVPQRDENNLITEIIATPLEPGEHE